ncbi:MAG: hypothetical protein M1389_14445 [Chloroflexi bacterium]|nr:hypothetical protein [Chloroflexota bacterium]
MYGPRTWRCPVCGELSAAEYCPRDAVRRPVARYEAPPTWPAYRLAPPEVFTAEVTWGDEASEPLGLYIPWASWLVLGIVVLTEISSAMEAGEPTSGILVAIAVLLGLSLLAGIIHRVRPEWIRALGTRLAPMFRPLWPRRLFRFELEVEREGYGRTPLFLDDPDPWPQLVRQIGAAGEAEGGADLLRGRWRIRGRLVRYRWGMVRGEVEGPGAGTEVALPYGRSIRSAERAYYVERMDPARPDAEDPADFAPGQLPPPVFSRRVLGPVVPFAFLALYLAIRAAGL